MDRLPPIERFSYQTSVRSSSWTRTVQSRRVRHKLKTAFAFCEAAWLTTMMDPTVKTCNPRRTTQLPIMKYTAILFLLSLSPSVTSGFSVQPVVMSTASQRSVLSVDSVPPRPRKPSASQLAASLDVETIGLVVGQETYGLAAVCLGEAAWSFSQSPSMSQLKVLLPGALAAIILGLVSGPMVTSGDVGSIGTGLFIATAVSIALGTSYVARYEAAQTKVCTAALLLPLASHKRWMNSRAKEQRLHFSRMRRLVPLLQNRRSL
jgi:hypothetical protein